MTGIEPGDTVEATADHHTIPDVAPAHSPRVLTGEWYQAMETFVDADLGLMVSLPLALPVTGGTIAQWVPVGVLRKVGADEVEQHEAETGQ